MGSPLAPPVQGVPCGQPLFVAFGSQSCVLLPAHFAAQIAEWPAGLRQQTWPMVQSAVAAQLRPTPMQPAPCWQLKSNPVLPSPGVTQHTCIVVLHELVPQVSAPLDPPSLGPPSIRPPSLEPPLLDDAVPLLLPLELDPPLLEVLPPLLPLLDDAVPLLLPLPPSPPPPPLVPEELLHWMAARLTPTRTVHTLLFIAGLLAPQSTSIVTLVLSSTGDH
jgi:hypothetical protein